jgi:hypothetical protein
MNLIMNKIRNSLHSINVDKLMFIYMNTPRNDSVRFGFDSVFATPVPNRQETEPEPVRFDLVRSLAGSEPKTKSTKSS